MLPVVALERAIPESPPIRSSSSLLQTPPRQLPSTPSSKTPFSFKHQDLSSPKTPSTPTNSYPRTPIGSSSIGPKSYSLLSQFSSSKSEDSSNRKAEKFTSPSPPTPHTKPILHIVMIDEVLETPSFLSHSHSHFLRLMPLGQSGATAPCRSEFEKIDGLTLVTGHSEARDLLLGGWP